MSLGTPQEMLDDERDYNESLKDITPKEEAKELVDKFLIAKIFSKTIDHLNGREAIEIAKQCALICVDKVLKNSLQLPVLLSTAASEEIYWQEVKQEINKL